MNLNFKIEKQTWTEVIKADAVDKKSELLQKIFLQKLDEYLPLKKKRVSSDAQAFCRGVEAFEEVEIKRDSQE